MEEKIPEEEEEYILVSGEWLQWICPTQVWSFNKIYMVEKTEFSYYLGEKLGTLFFSEGCEAPGGEFENKKEKKVPNKMFLGDWFCEIFLSLETIQQIKIRKIHTIGHERC